MKVDIKVSLIFNDKKIVKTIYGSLKPDNLNLPEGLSLDMWIKNRKLIIKIDSEAKHGTLINTTHEILGDCQVAILVLQKTKIKC